MKMNKRDMEIVIGRANIVSKKGSIKEGPMVVVKMSGGKMSVRSAFPQQAGISISGIKVDSDDDIEFIIDGDRLLSVLKRFPAGEFHIDAKPTEIVIRSGRTRYKIPKIVGVEAQVAMNANGKTFRVMCDDLCRKMKMLVPSTDNSSMSGPYDGVYMSCDGDDVVMVASDRKNVVRTTMGVMDMADGGFTAIVPTDIDGFLGVFDVEKFLDVEVRDNCMIISQDEMVVWFSLISGGYMDLSESVIREKIKSCGGKTLTKFGVDRSDILDILSRMEVVVDRSIPRIQISIDENVMSISCKSSSGSCEDECVISSSGKRDMFMNLYYLRKILYPLSSDTVEFEIFDNGMILFIHDRSEGLHAFCACMTDPGGRDDD